ncbi:MAG: 1-acyl-sn-glycerol-3-phosphate acyltransferase [Phocaeicola sp.]
MGNLFVQIYNYFSRCRKVMWTLLLVTTLIMMVGAMQVRYVEDITSFFPKQAQDLSLVFENLPAKDKLVVMFSPKEGGKMQEKDCTNNPQSSLTQADGDSLTLAMEGADSHNSDLASASKMGGDCVVDELIHSAESFAALLAEQEGFQRNASLTLGVDDVLVDSLSHFIYEYLPLWLNHHELGQLDSLFSEKSIAATVRSNYNQLLSPLGGYISDFIYKDPLLLGAKALGSLQNLGNNIRYKVIDGYIFSYDEKMLLCYIEPQGVRNSSSNEELIDIIEAAVKVINNQNPTVHVDYFGAPAVAVYNARQIKQDTMLTLNIAILLVVLCMGVVFKNRYAPLLVILPVLYGGLFALSVIYLLTGEISLIAVGAGSVVLGIALSYSIHLLAHTNHSHSMEQVIRELVYPLTVGSFTTIGAFVGLMFTNSKLLQDFGLFSSLTLVGTTLFVLVFLPQLLNTKGESGASSRILSWVDRLCSKSFDKKRGLVWTIFLLTLVLGFFSNDVKFDSDMMNLNYNPTHLQRAEERLNHFIGKDSTESTVLFIASAPTVDEAVENYNLLCRTLDSLKTCGKISSFSSIDQFVVSDSLQRHKLHLWSQYWEKQSPDELYNRIKTEALKVGFEEDTYLPFSELLAKNYSPLSYDSCSVLNNLFKEWFSSNASITSFAAQVKLNADDKEMIYSLFSEKKGIVAVDRSFFASKMAEDVNENFYLILYLSGVLVFFALLLSYGRIELTLISFLPMCFSWLIILGVMSICGISFNIVTIILSTFIFGIGDDFSIFIMDGLLSEYRDRREMLTHHKTAIFFSAFAVLVGMGALIFAKHPAVHALSIISVVGIVVVVVVAYTIQPFIFRKLITLPTQQGLFPYTLVGLLRSLYAFSLFVLGCSILQGIIPLLFLFPIGGKRRKRWIHIVLCYFIRFFLWAMFFLSKKQIVDTNENFEKPAVIIANHQSFIDILVLLSLHPKLVMVTKEWVWKSPIFGRIIRYLDFFHAGEGHEALVDSLQQKVKEGYSIVIFPEGTRSPDCKIKRFHKGAFYLAEDLKIDILPIVLYGNGWISSKRQPLYIKAGLIATKILPRISASSTQFGLTYQERSKQVAAYFRNEYQLLYEEYNRSSNPYFRGAIIQNYIYKGPVLEWYMRVKLALEGWYDLYDRLLPRSGTLVDLGCGYGAMSYMLSMLSDQRKIVGVDYDDEKIALAQHAFLKHENISFEQADIRTYNIPPADGYIISDVLHYIDRESQRKVIEQCMAGLRSGGVLVIREGDTSVEQKHAQTEETERWSTKILKFNKSEGELFFLSRVWLEEVAKENSMDMRVVESSSKTSNTLFVFTHTKK